MRATIAPVFTRLAILRDPEAVERKLAQMQALPDTAQDFTATDIELQRVLTILSGNPIYTLIFNGFEELYRVMGPLYFSLETARNRSRRFYQQLYQAARQRDADAGERLTLEMMTESIHIWETIRNKGEQTE